MLTPPPRRLVLTGRLAVALAIGVLSIGAPALALTVTGVKAQIELDGTTSVQVKGKLDGLVVSGAAFVRIAVDGIGFDLPLSGFTLKSKKVRYEDPTAPIGVRELVLDPAHGKFSGKLVGLLLGGVHSPLTVELTTSAAAGCALLPVSDPRAGKKPLKKPKPLKLKYVKFPRHGSAACDLGSPVFDPAQALVGDPPSVYARVAVSGVPAAGSVQLWMADAVGRPTGAALCTMVDDGSAGDGAAADGTFTCPLTMPTGAPTTLVTVATASLAGLTERSPVGTFRVVPPLADADVAILQQVQVLAAQTWAAKKAALGDGLAARFETMRVLQAQPGVDAVTLGNEAGSIIIHYSSGVVGFLLLDPRLPATDAAPASPPSSLRSGIGARDADPAPVAEVPPAEAVVVGNHEVLVFDPGHFGAATETQGIVDTYEASTCPKFHLTKLTGASADVEALRAVTDYGTIVFVTHGTVDVRAGWTAMVTTVGTPTDDDLKMHAAELQRGDLFTSGDGLAIGAGFVRRLAGTFPKSLVWGGYCYSGLDNSSNGLNSTANGPRKIDRALAAAYGDKGVGGYFGFSRAVSSDYAILVAKKIFPDLVTRQRDTLKVFDDFEPKYDAPRLAEVLHGDTSPEAREKGLSIMARVVLRPVGGKPLVYLKPTLTPEAPIVVEPDDAVELEVKVEGADDCTLAYRWRNSASFGNLDGGDDTQSTSPKRTYRSGGNKGTDSVTVDVIDTGAAPPAVLYRLTAPVTVGCTKCAHGGTNAQTRAGDACVPVEACCSDHEDNDGDGKVDCDDSDCTGDAACASCDAATPPACPPGTTDPLTTCRRTNLAFDLAVAPLSLSAGESVKISVVPNGMPFCSGFQNECLAGTSIAAAGSITDHPNRALGCTPGHTPQNIQFSNNVPNPCDADILHTGCLRFDSAQNADGPFWLAIRVLNAIQTATPPAPGTYYPGSLQQTQNGWQYALVADAVVRVTP